MAKILSNDYEVFIPSNQLKHDSTPYKVHLKVESVINYEVLAENYSYILDEIS